MKKIQNNVKHVKLKAEKFIQKAVFASIHLKCLTEFCIRP